MLHKVTDGYVGASGVAIHPGDGTMYFAFWRVTPKGGKNMRNIEVWKTAKPGAASVLIASLRQGVETPGPFAHPGIAVHPSGVVIVSCGYDTDPKGDDDAKVFGGYYAISGHAVPWKSPAVQMSTTVDLVARTSASQAIAEVAAARLGISNAANTANSAASIARAAESRAKATADALGKAATELKHSLAMIEQKTGQAVGLIEQFREDIIGLAGSVPRTAQDVLVAAIEYAKAHTTGSRLRALIEQVVGEQKKA